MNKITIRRFKNMIKPYWKKIILVTILSLIIDGVELAKPYIIQQVIDNYLRAKVFVLNNISITMMAVIYIVLVLGGNIVDYINRCISYNLGERVLYDLRSKLFRFIEKSNLSFHDKTPSGKLYVRVTSDTEDIYSLFTEVITTFPKDLIIIIGLTIAMIALSLQLSSVNFIMIVILVISTVLVSRIMTKIHDKSKIARTKLNTFLAESIYGAKLIKIFNRQKEKQIECENKTEEHRKQTKNLGYFYGLFPGMIAFIENLATAAVIVFCVYHIGGINLDIGIIYLFISYLKKIIDPIDRMVENVDIVTDAFSSIDKIYDVIEKEEYIEDFESGIKLKDIKGKIEFKNVWFAYEKNNWVLKDVSFTIEPGQSVALVGKTGSGKTTITALISRFYEIQKGEILLDGINIKDINLKSLRSNIGTILQDPFIFARTIKENIKMYSDISENEITDAINVSSANYFIDSLPNKIDEVARERRKFVFSRAKATYSFC